MPGRVPMLGAWHKARALANAMAPASGPVKQDAWRRGGHGRNPKHSSADPSTGRRTQMHGS
eukprot:364915-Chlamydomonas_euryale.AAC.24